ncbi:hypothetical protein [Pseudomonas sp. BGI-2]|uniref:hypothetical protein n=1 Tax=Pseudomonas sp. BGI-2 TaxID=2528211 RepID=UPI001033B57A|nr:hypothetical protein [Pseudomonas sp. BGI-2]TBN40279.1 hypothetical protein EYC95_19890 [Pseudomonas sp. BGI-2]
MSKPNETSHPGTHKNTVDETPQTLGNPPHIPVLPEEVLTNGITPKYLEAHGNKLEVTIKPYADKSYDHVALKFGTPPNSYTVNARLSSLDADTVVIFTTDNIRGIGNGLHPLSYELFKLADNSTSPRSPSQEVKVKGM